ncbi:hypothetical protein [Moraxella sp.]|uniref:hypothetical protein n=1 Tax=Moraxella sp. TaxID=479 RepID=UPI0026DDAD8A|nr:hypothetical protein [Moraxella sp.]MDO4895000.1 hypothetical protein [Moraxella sp.]
MQQELIKAAAMSFAHIDTLDYACHHYIYNADNQDSQRYADELYRHYIRQFEQTHQKIKPAHLIRTVKSALAESQHPATRDDGYAWTTKDRYLFAGISRTEWYRYHLNTIAKFITDDIRHRADKVEALTARQLSEYYRPTIDG